MAEAVLDIGGSSGIGWRPVAPTPSPRRKDDEAPAPAGRYGEARRPGWPALGLILGLHAVLIAALCYFDVLTITHKAAPRLTVVEIKPLPLVPPPAAAPKPTAEKAPPVERPIVAPPPIVQVPVQTLPVAAAPAVPPAPPAPPPSAPAAAAAILSDSAAPVSAPDGTARTLGNPPPRYPTAARRQHQEGVVRLRVVITAEGRVKEIAVARSSGFDSLDDAALGTVRRWRFVPGKQAGVPVEAVGFLNIPFRLT